MKKLCVVIILLVCGCVRVNMVEQKSRILPSMVSGDMDSFRDDGVVLPRVLNLATAESLAIAHNPNISVAVERIVASRARLKRAYSAYYPQLSLDGGGQHTKANLMYPGLENYDTYSVTLSTSFLLFDGLQREYRVLASKYGVESSQWACEEFKRVLLGGVDEAFYSALLAKKLIDIAVADEKINLDLLEQTKKRRHVGGGTDTAVFNFRVRVNNSKLALWNYRKDYRIAKIVLLELLGYTEVDCEKLDLEFGDIDMGKSISFADAKVTAFERHPSLQKLNFDIGVAKAQKRRVWGEFFPQIALFNSIGTNGMRGDGFDRDDDNIVYGVSLKWNIFNGGATRNAIKEAQANIDMLEKRLLGEWNKVVRELKESFVELKVAKEKLKILKENVKLNEDIYENTFKSYKLGKIGITRVNEVLSNLSIAKANYSIGYIGVMVKRARLRTAMGIYAGK